MGSRKHTTFSSARLADADQPYDKPSGRSYACGTKREGDVTVMRYAMVLDVKGVPLQAVSVPMWVAWVGAEVVVVRVRRA